MNSVDSTLEALTLHYVGIGLFSVVNNIWTLAALVTAAVSFWRLRGASLLLHLPGHSRRVGSLHEREYTSKSIDSGPESSIRESVTVPAVILDTDTAAAPLACIDGATKGKFVAYYREDEECDVAAAVEEEEKVCDQSLAGEWWEGWEKAWRMRRKGAEKGTGGWYNYQDLEVLNGSVVRLWEEETSPLRQSMRCVLW